MSTYPVTSREYALELDAHDPLADYRNEFVITDPDVCYLDGNSLGRLPKKTVEAVNSYLLNEWGSEVVDGWGHWIDEPLAIGDLLGRSVLGAGPGQVVCSDTTSVNFYQLVGAALRARPDRKTIITDASNFPTDRFILQGYAEQHGYNLVVIDNENPSISSHERITPEILEKYLNDDVALVTLEVVQYRAGARNDVKAITDLVRKYGGLTIWDASHSAGSVDMRFDEDGVDLAVGCTYKYCNGGPGAPGYLYVSKRVQKELRVPIQGWFANKNQFEMGPKFEKVEDIRGFQIATPPILAYRCVKVALEMIEQAQISRMEAKCASGTAMMIELYEAWLKPLGFTLNTPRDAKERGGHVSLVHPDAKQIAVAMRRFIKVIPDYRVPNSIRLAMSPLTTSYAEVWDGMDRLRELVSSGRYKELAQDNSRVS